MFDLPQDILKKLLETKNAAPERLTASEHAIADRVCWCALCGSFWVRRLARRPKRCPKCQKPAWDRPLIQTMLEARAMNVTGYQVTDPLPGHRLTDGSEK